MKSVATISIAPGAGKNNDSQFHTAKNNGGALLPLLCYNSNAATAFQT